MPNKTSIKKIKKKGFKILMGSILKYRKEILFLSFLGVVSALANGTIPYIVGSFFDAILNGQYIVLPGITLQAPLWAVLLVLFGFVQMVASFVDWINSKKSQQLAMVLYTMYLVKIKSHLLRLPMSFHSGKKIGEMHEKINRGASSLDSIVDNTILPLIPQFLSIFIGFSISFFISVEVGFIFIVAVGLYVFILSRLSTSLDSLIRDGNKAWDKAHNTSYESIDNIDAVKKFTTEGGEIKKIYNEFVNIAGKTWNKVNDLRADIDFYQRVVILVTQILVFTVSVFLIQKGEITIGELITLNGYSAMIFGPFVILGKNWQSVQNGLLDLEAVDNILQISHEKYKPENAVMMKEIKGDIEFRNVNFHYNKKDGDILKNINFKISAGETIALVGESGVGKSTLIELISAYYFAQKGNVFIDDVDIRKINLKFLRKNIAVVSQEIDLFNDSIKVNIKYGNLKATTIEIKQAAKEAYADVFIEKFTKKYNQEVGYMGVKLSVGQKQRIAIARAILRNPKILILDEPTSALDSKSEKFITESLEKLMQGRTTFIVAHRLSTVRKANRILVFKEGRIVEEGSHNELMKIKKGVYHELYNLHIGLN